MIVFLLFSVQELKKVNPESLVPSQMKPRYKKPVPKLDEKPVMHLVTICFKKLALVNIFVQVSKKDFVTANAVDNIIRAPPQPKKQEADWLHKAAYGKVPAYLNKVKKDINEEYEYIKKVDVTCLL